MHVIRRTIAVAALLGLFACGGPHSRQQPGPARPAMPAQLAAYLPALPAPHAGAGLTETSIDGSAVYDKSSDAVANVPVLELGAAAGAACWGIWELPALDELRYLDLSLSIDEGEQAYLALADYSRGVWDITGPVYSRRVLELDPAKHASPSQGLYVLVLVYDGASAAVNRLTLVANHANAAPVAALDATPQSGAAPLAVSFDAAASSDPDADIVRYLWDFNGDGLFEATSYTPSAAQTYVLPGLFEATVAVEDSAGERDMASVSISVNAPGNAAPSADLSAVPASGHAPLRVEFDGTGSSDPDGAIVKYEWDFEGDGGWDSYGPTGTVSFTYVHPGPYNPILRVTDDAGAQASATLAVQAWLLPLSLDSAGVTGWYTSLAVVFGRPAISYYDNTNGDLRYVRATDATGTAWAEPVTVDSAGNVGYYTSLAVIEGKPAISYQDLGNGDLRFVRALDAGGLAWGTPYTVDSPGAAGYFTSLAVVSGNPAVSYCLFSFSGGDLRFVRASDADGAAWGAPLTVDSTGDTGLFTSLAIVNGLPAISYSDVTNGDLRYVRAADTSGAAWGAPLTVDSVGDTGLYTSLAVVNGGPAISYFDNTSGNLRFVRATNPNGSAWSPPLTLDSAGYTGTHTSLAVINGNPAVCYYDDTNADLRYIRATNAHGSLWGVPRTLDSEGTTGTYSSLAAVGGNAAISYYDTNTGSLKYVVAY